MSADARAIDSRGWGESVNRVIFVTYYYSPYVSGLTICTRAIAEGLAARGWDVHIVCSHHLPTTAACEDINGVTVHRLPVRGGVDKGVVVPGLVPTALRLARGDGTVVPVLPLLEAGLIARAMPRRRCIPFYVCDLRLGTGMASRVIERLAAASARYAVRRSVAFAALSEEYARASRVIGDIERPVVGLTPPVDPERWRQVDARAMREQLRIPPTSKIVGFVGRLVPEKGIPVLLDAFRTLRVTNPDVRLLIAGDGDAVAGGGLGDEVRRMTRNDASVMLTGFLSDADLPAFYSMLDVLALPSVDPLEAFGMVQVEAMLCGTPVVASDMPGVRIPVTRTGMGLLAPPGDSDGLARALAQVLGHPGDFAVGREAVAREFDPTVTIDAMDGLLRVLGE